MSERPCNDDNTTTSTPEPPADRPLCPVCWTPFTRIRRQRYCTDACRKTAWTRRHAATRQLTEAAVPQYHGEQWCHDCNQPCARVGIGGSCPHCAEPVALADLLDTKEAINR